SMSKTRWVQLKKTRCRQHSSVQGITSRVIADQHRSSTRRNILDSGAADLEVMAVEGSEHDARPHQALFRHSVGIDTGFVEWQLQALYPAADFLVQCAHSSALAIQQQARNVNPYMTVFRTLRRPGASCLAAKRRPEPRSERANSRTGGRKADCLIPEGQCPLW